MIRFADISEFQTGANLAVYRSECDVIIVRAHNGYRPDYRWPAWRDEVRKLNFTAIGYYQYLAGDRDAGQQAIEFANTVGLLRDNEFCILDSEEGATSPQGIQITRCNQWFNFVDKHYGRTSSLYASESWFRDQLGGSYSWSRPIWMAAYRAMEPTDQHDWWQNSSSANFSGMPAPCDGSIYHESSEGFARLTTGKLPTPIPPKPPEPEPSYDVSMAIAAQVTIGHEIFVELNSGEIRHCPQSPNKSWGPWQTLGTPGG